jgi:hypothetical protein
MIAIFSAISWREQINFRDYGPFLQGAISENNVPFQISNEPQL